MPSASILTKSVDQVVSAVSTTTIDVTWDTETKYLDGAYDFHDPVTDNNRLTIPAAMDGSLYEVFIWVEDANDLWDTVGGGTYIGLLSSGIPDWNNWWGIYQDTGKFSRGVRTGLLTANAAEGYFFSQVREFEPATATASASKCRFGIIEGNPNPIAIAGAREVGYSAGTGVNNLAITETYDPNSVYNPSTGVFVAPPGATLACVTANGYLPDKTDSDDFEYELWLNGAQYAAFRHSGSLRGYGPGTFGLMPVSPGDELVVRTHNFDSGARTGNFSTGIEFW